MTTSLLRPRSAVPPLLGGVFTYIEERRRAAFREKMKNGYIEMAELNRLLAEELAGDLDPTQVGQFPKSELSEADAARRNA